eukprot:jgi/Ulvmu1/4410/UM002_0135.1
MQERIVRCLILWNCIVVARTWRAWLDVAQDVGVVARVDVARPQWFVTCSPAARPRGPREGLGDRSSPSDSRATPPSSNGLLPSGRREDVALVLHRYSAPDLAQKPSRFRPRAIKLESKSTVATHNQVAMDGRALKTSVEVAGGVSTPVVSPAEEIPLSKNQQKKLAKLKRKQEMHRMKKEAKKKEKRKRQAERLQGRADQAPLTEEERSAKRAAMQEKYNQRVERTKALAFKLQHAETNAPKLVLDLDFWNLMAEGSQRSLVSQLAFSAGCNKKSENPCSLHFTSFTGEVAEATARQFPGHINWAVQLHSEHWSRALSRHKEALVYLTADAEDEIETLDPKCYYIVGGLVDRNKLKRICFNRANEHGIRTARLPLDSCLALAGSKVLTVNQVVLIIVHYWVTRDWSKACHIAVPERKLTITSSETVQAAEALGPK